MRKMPPVRLFAIALVASLSIAATPPAKRNWDQTVAETPEGGHLVGNPEAEVKLVEYVSYTCSHCAHFEIEAEAPLRLTFISTGKGSVEYRPLLRNKIDLAVTLLATCGPPSKFRGNHARFLRSQEKWFGDFSAAQQQRWASPDFGKAMRAIAGDLKLYDQLSGRGYTRVQLDRCLSDEALGKKLAAQSTHAVEQLGVKATPSFLINGKLQDVHDWSGLRPRLAELLR
jgi:protein-disulfide isomerase